MNVSKLTIISLNVLIVICALIMTTYFHFPIKYDDFHSTTTMTMKFYELLEFLPIQDAFGPESLTFDPAGNGPYTGVSDGRILKWVSQQRRWVDFAFTSPQRDICGNQSKNHEEMEYKCGRPLGLKFNEKTGELYIADAYLGLMVVGQEGGLATTVVTQVEDVPLGFTNGLDIDQQTGIVYFTCSSTRYPRRNYMSLILSKDTTGRLLKYDPRTKQATKLLDNLTFPNGVSLSSDASFLLLVDTTNCNILRYCLQQNTQKPKPNKPQVLAQLPGYADNINRNSKGEYWVGIYSKRGNFLKWLLSFPLLRNTILNLPFNAAVQFAKLFVRFRSIGLAVKLDQNGNLLHLLQDTTGHLKFVSEVLEKDGNLWFGSVIFPFATFYNHSHSLL